jgi:hypothetical protein
MNNILRIAFRFSNKIDFIPTLKEFVATESKKELVQFKVLNGQKFHYHIETYGCQMNVNDSEIVRSILNQNYIEVQEPSSADIVFLNTCAIREAAE